MILSVHKIFSIRVHKLASALFFLFVIGTTFSGQAIACHKDNPHGPNGEPCDGGGGGSGDNTPQIIGVHRHSGLSSSALLWAPTESSNTCVLQKNSGKSLSGAFPRHDLCASLPNQDVAWLRDDIIIIVHTSNRGEVLGVEVQGQDWIGTGGIVHISEGMVPDSVSNNPDGTMVIHVHEDLVPLYQCDTHVLRNKSVCDYKVAQFALHDLVYTPDP